MTPWHWARDEAPALPQPAHYRACGRQLRRGAALSSPAAQAGVSIALETMMTVNPDSRDRPCAGKRQCLAGREDCLTPTEDVGSNGGERQRSPTRCPSSGNCGRPPDRQQRRELNVAAGLADRARRDALAAVARAERRAWNRSHHAAHPHRARWLEQCGDIESNPGPKFSEILALAIGELRALEGTYEEEIADAVDTGSTRALAVAHVKLTDAEAQVITTAAKAWQDLQAIRAEALQDVMAALIQGPRTQPDTEPVPAPALPWCPEFPTHDRLQSWTHLSASEILVGQQRADFWPWLEELEYVRQLRSDADYQVDTLASYVDDLPNCMRRNELQEVLKRLKSHRGAARNLVGSDTDMFRKCVTANNPLKCRWLTPTAQSPENIGSWGLPRPTRRWRREDYIRRLIMLWDGSTHRWWYRGRPGVDSDFVRVTKGYDVVRVVKRTVPGGNAVAVVYLSPCPLNIGALKPRRRNVLANHLWADYYRDQRPADTFQPQEPHSLVVDEKMMNRVLRERGADQACVKHSLLCLSMRAEGRDLCLGLPNRPVADMAELRKICAAWSAVEARDLNVYVAWVNGSGPASLHLRYQFTTGKSRTWSSPVIASLIILNTQGPDGKPRTHCCPSSGAVKDGDRCLSNHYGLRGPDYCVEPEVVVVSAKEYARSAFMTSLLGEKDVAAEQELKAKILMLHDIQQENEQAVAESYEAIPVPPPAPKKQEGRTEKKWRLTAAVKDALEGIGLAADRAPTPPRDLTVGEEALAAPEPALQVSDPPPAPQGDRSHIQGLELLYRCNTNSGLIRSLCMLAAEGPAPSRGPPPPAAPRWPSPTGSSEPPSPPGKAKERWVRPITPDCAEDAELAEILERIENPTPPPKSPDPEASSAPRPTLDAIERAMCPNNYVTLERLQAVVPVAKSASARDKEPAAKKEPVCIADLPRHPSDNPRYKKTCERCGNDFIITAGEDERNIRSGRPQSGLCSPCRAGVQRLHAHVAKDPSPPLQYPKHRVDPDPRVNDSGEWDADGGADPKRCRRERPPHPDKFGDPPCKPVGAASGRGLAHTDSGVSLPSGDEGSVGGSDSDVEKFDPSIITPPVQVTVGVQSMPSTVSACVQADGVAQSLPTYRWPPTRTIIYEGEINQIRYPCNWRAGWWEVPTEGARVGERAPLGWIKKAYQEKHRWDGGPWSNEPRTDGFTMKDALSRLALNPSICLATETNLRRWGDNTLYIEPRVQQGYRFIRKGVLSDNACHAVQCFRVDSIISRGKEEWSAMPIDMVMPDGGKLRLLQLVRLDTTLGLGPLCSSLFPSWTWGKAAVKCYSPHSLKTLDSKQLNAAKWLGTAKACANNPVLLGFINLHRAAGDLSDPDEKLDFYRMLACTYQMPVNISGPQDKDHCFRRLRSPEKPIVGQISGLPPMPHHKH